MTSSAMRRSMAAQAAEPEALISAALTLAIFSVISSETSSAAAEAAEGTTTAR
jgi:hypothetical protein